MKKNKETTYFGDCSNFLHIMWHVWSFRFGMDRGF